MPNSPFESPTPLELWLIALRSKYGILIETNDRELLRSHLYKARQEQGNPLLDQLCIIHPKEESQLWIVHKDADERLKVEE